MFTVLNGQYSKGWKLLSKKEELLLNAAKIIYEEGIQQLTISYLAEKSNLTKGGILYHFSNKDNLLLQMNKMAINKFEKMIEHFKGQLTGKSLFTRAYAYATLEFFKHPEDALLPAVFISSLENDASFQLWKEVSKRWEHRFQNDSGNSQQNLTLRLLCDGIWFAILYGADEPFNDETKALVLKYCEQLSER